ncbi:MAG: GDSL family lipase, partial [Planctomycetota bacterium]
PGLGGMTLSFMRAEVAAAVKALQQRGDQHLGYCDGLRLFGPDLADFMPDGLHPNAEGCRRLGQRYLEHVAPWLISQTG